MDAFDDSSRSLANYSKKNRGQGGEMKETNELDVQGRARLLSKTKTSKQARHKDGRMPPYMVDWSKPMEGEPRTAGEGLLKKRKKTENAPEEVAEEVQGAKNRLGGC